MKKYFILPVLAVLFLLSACDKNKVESYPYELHLITEEYNPLNYTENDTLKGLAADVMHLACDRLNAPFNVSVKPWEEGYQQALSDDHAVLFATILNTERKDLFKWAGPVASLDWYFYGSATGTVTLSSVEDAKSVARIGVLRDYSITQTLTGEGFTNLVYCDDNVDAFNKLLSGEIDLFPSDKLTAEAALAGLGKTIYAVNPRLIIRTDLVYIAFNKGVPDGVVADFQREIDRMKGDGTLRNLTERYFRSSDYPGTLLVYTENYPPLTFRNDMGDITGFGTDIAREIMTRNDIFPDIRMTLWSIGYQTALDNPNVCLFTMDRTELRENLFQWVGPIGTNTTWFYTRAGSGITIDSLGDARRLNSVGVVSSWFSAQYLANLGFTNLVSDRDPGTMAKKLMNGEIDAFVCTGITFPDILKAAGYDYSGVVPSFALMSSDYYIAFSLTTPVETVNKWQQALEAMKGDGTYDAIYQKWLK